MIESNKLKKLENYLKRKAEENHLDIYFNNFSYPNTFPNEAFLDAYHLKIGYWRNYYAYLLSEYIENRIF